ncbi:MAG: hypothetical protein LBJ07_01595, partial [Actinomycetes bacterium]|nr:hypothetical protein [Actinomycetes bacterium]
VSLREISGRQLQSARGKLLGTADDVLFDPHDLRALGLSIKRQPGALSVLGGNRMKWRYIARQELRCNDDGTLAIAKQAPAQSSINWDDTLILYGLPVVCQDGTPLGKVADARLDWSTGILEGIALSAGVTADTALGKRLIPATLLRGFVAGVADNEPHVLVVANQAADIVHPGGVAATAGTVAATVGAALSAQVGAHHPGQVAGKVAASAARGVGRVVADRRVRGVYGRAMSALSGFGKAYREGLQEDDQSDE